jgi:hypothetical protein
MATGGRRSGLYHSVIVRQIECNKKTVCSECCNEEYRMTEERTRAYSQRFCCRLINVTIHIPFQCVFLLPGGFLVN